jgi:phosphatidylglycerol:prolipoprotein diacylglycerol transferase
MRQVNAGLISESAQWSLPVHPTQLYAAVAALAVLAALLAYFPFRRHKGEVISLLMVTYSITRLPIEALRADERVAVFAGMNSAQMISLALLLIGAAAWLYLRFAPAVTVNSTAPQTPAQLAQQ